MNIKSQNTRHHHLLNPWLIASLVVVMAVLVVAGFYLLRQTPAQALSGADFKAGRIIDDAVFYNEDAMNPASIQAFLEARVPVCDTNGSQPASDFGRPDITRAQYAASRGWQSPPYICLRNYTQNTPQMAASSGLCAGISAGTNRSGAQIIYDIAKACHINPQVLVVLLEKEQSLVRDTWPLNSQYNKATGFACPDTAPCDPSYGGFFYQVYYAARQFQIYKNNPNNYNYVAGRNNNIYYHPNLSGCGSSQVYIENQATAALYIYTPYQPNAVALSNIYGGQTDGCSSYGNRNFWRLFSDWFGSTYATAFSAQPTYQQIYSDASKDTPLGWNANLTSGQSAYAVVVMKNTGNTTWTKSGAFGVTDTRLVTYGPWGRNSALCTSGWLIDCTRPTGLKEDSVPPGSSGTFEFPIRAPLNGGTYTEAFGLVVDGRTVFSSGVMVFSINVSPAVFSAQPVWQQIYTNSSKSTSLGWNANLVTGQSAYAVVVMKNTGNTVWTKSGGLGVSDTRLVTYGSWGRNSAFCDSSWVIGCTRPSGLKEDSVAPGATGTFEFALKAPSTPGIYTEPFSLVVDGRTVFSSGVMVFNSTVSSSIFSAQPVYQQIYSDASKDTPLGWNANLTSGQSAYAVVVMKNTGNTTWTKSGAFGVTDTRLVTYGPWGRNSAFCDSSWVIECSRPVALKEDSVAPGATGTFEFAIQAPSSPGTYAEPFSLVVDGRTVFSSGVMVFNSTVL